MEKIGVKTAVILISVLFLIVSLAPIAAQASEWVQKADTPEVGGYGEAVIGTDENIYVARCLYASSTPYFWRYNPVTDSWTSMNTSGLPTGAFRNGAALTWDHNDSIFALLGGRYTDSNRRLFYEYSISTNKWQRLADTLHAQGAGDAMTWSGYDGLIYALLGSKEHGTAFVCYNISTNSWSYNTPLPVTDDGASLAWAGGEYLYALRGEWQETVPCQDFFRYHIPTDTWSARSPIPESGGVGDGGSLLWTDNQTNYIFALGGNSCLEDPGYNFSSYSISSDSWEELESIPCPVGYYVGNRLGFANGTIYYWQGAPSTWNCGGDAFYMFELPGSTGVIISIGDVSTDPEKIKPGNENVKISVVITNEGNNLARDVEAILQLTDKFNTSYPGSNHSYIEILNANESSEAVFHINIADNIEPGLYHLPLQISFKDIENRDFNVTHEVAILVKPTPDFKIMGYTDPENIVIGKRDVALHVLVENIGSENAESVSLWISNKTKEIFTFDESRIFLGNLSMGEEVEAIFNFDVSDNLSAEVYPLDIDIVCIGDRNVGDDDVYIFHKIINLEVCSIFDTGFLNVSFPSISGTHNGTISPSSNITVSKLYTYPCPGTGGHTEHIKIWKGAEDIVEKSWNGYTGDWHNLTFNNSFTLYANETYNYTIVTGSYPQIIHEPSWDATGGVITCTEFVDRNGKRHEGWTPAIRLS